ncbi:MAG: PorV/PorQ family protein [Candidatus Zixiibacteriota bacterium]|nr:MAG: PorV/PorQ family protein [candidate division Zixibacteria bacterium]
MKCPITFYVIIFQILLWSPCLSESECGGSAGAFLDIGIGAKAIAMGKAYSAMAGDATALFWNPAGLALSDKKEISAMHAFIFEDRAINYAAFVYPISGHSLGAAWIRFGVTGIQERGDTGQLISEFSDSENLYMLGYGRSLWSDAYKSISLGTTIRYYYHSLFGYSASGWAADFGALFTLYEQGFANNLNLSIAVQNIGGDIKWNTPGSLEENIPTSFRFGSSAELNSLPITFAIDLEKQEDRSVRFHSGLEYVYGSILPLRIGFSHKYLSAGIGYIIETGKTDIIVDYAFTDDRISDRGLHFFSIGVRF